MHKGAPASGSHVGVIVAAGVHAPGVFVQVEVIAKFTPAAAVVNARIGTVTLSSVDRSASSFSHAAPLRAHTLQPAAVCS
jgi:hypothetical protein